MVKSYIEWHDGLGFEYRKGRRHFDKGDVLVGIYDGNRYYTMFEIWSTPWLHDRMHLELKRRNAPEGT